MHNQFADIRFMSFNIRFPCESDTGNLWDERRARVFEMIQLYDPDVIGMQEVYRRQLNDLLSALPGYAAVGKERYGGTDEEHNPVFFRRERFLAEGSTTKWFSDTPDVPGTRTFCPSDHPRIVTSATLMDIADGFRFSVLNTHFPLTRDEDIQLACARVVESQLALVPKSAPVVLMGDFNAPPDGGLHGFFTRSGGGIGEGFRDTRVLAQEVLGPAGTVHGFRGGMLPESRRIDWVLLAGEGQVTRYETVAFERDGKYPSDHFPVCVDIRFAQPEN